MKHILILLLLITFSACRHPKITLPDMGDNGIYFHGGGTMNEGVNVYFIWYGNWNNDTATEILPDLIRGINGSAYFNINTTYYDYSGNYVKNNVNYMGSINDLYSRTSVIDDYDIEMIVSNAIYGGKLPLDENGVYFVLTSNDIDQTQGFCTQNCGWHTNLYIQNKSVKIAFIGNASYQCQTNGAGVLMNGTNAGKVIPARSEVLGNNAFNSCITQLTLSPNGNPGADGMASVVAHELSEATTDPNLDAWYDNSNQECADKCAWTFGDTYKAKNGSMANINLGGRDFYIQQNWINASNGKCAMSYGE